MKRIWKEGKKRTFPAWRLFLAGFLLGILLPNILWKLKWQQQTIASMYLIRTFAKDEVSGPAYLLEVLRIRGSFFLLSSWMCPYDNRKMCLKHEETLHVF